MLKKVRYILCLIAAQDFNPLFVSSCLGWIQPSFEEYFGLLILMKYYYYQDFDTSQVYVEFFRRFRDRISAQFPNDNDARRMWLIRTNAYLHSDQLKNETDLEMVTKNAIRILFPI